MITEKRVLRKAVSKNLILKVGLMSFYLLICLFMFLGVWGCGKKSSTAVHIETEQPYYPEITETYRIVVDRSALPWESNNFKVSFLTGVVKLPEAFEIPSMSRVDNGGWFDFIVGSKVYCYQGRFKTKLFKFKYVKVAGATQGCDKNNEKSNEVVNFSAAISIGERVQIIPRAPRYDVVEEFEFTVVGVGE